MVKAAVERAHKPGQRQVGVQQGLRAAAYGSEEPTVPAPNFQPDLFKNCHPLATPPLKRKEPRPVSHFRTHIVIIGEAGRRQYAHGSQNLPGCNGIQTKLSLSVSITPDLLKRRAGELLPNVLEQFGEFLETHGKLTVAVFSILYWATTCFLGASKLLWYDELWSYYPAKLPSIAATWNFFSQGNDLHTPLASLAIRASITIFGDNELAVRLPVIACYWLMCVCVYAFLHRYGSTLFAAAGMVFPVIASAYYYATEARPYGIVLGFSAAALLCWQRAGDIGRHKHWRVAALWFCVAAAVCAHFLGVFVLAALLSGEAVRTWSRRRIDWPVVLALVLGVVPLLSFIPGALAARRIYAGSFWARPGLMDIPNTYRDLISLAFFPLLAALIIWAIGMVYANKTRAEGTVSFPIQDVIAVTLLALLPVYAMPVFFVLGSFVPRYLLYTIVGLTISLAMLAYRASRGNRLLGSALVIAFTGWFLFKAPSEIKLKIAERGGHLLGPAHPFADADWMSQIETSHLPVAVTPAVFYLQLQHYAMPPVKQRIFYLLSRQDALRYTGASTGDLNLEILSRYLSIQAIAYSRFISQHSHFLVCAEMTNPTWMVEKLLQTGARVQLLTRQDTHFLFDVDTNIR